MLEAEGVQGRIDVVGDVMADANMRLAPLARERSRILQELESRAGRLRRRHGASRGERRNPTALRGSSKACPGWTSGSIFPAHPRTRAAIASNRLLLGTNVALVDPLGYMDFAALASQARVILTDSGGLQKEAYWYGVPCVTLRPSTEWKDTVELGANVLVDDDPDAIAKRRRMHTCPPTVRSCTATARPRAESQTF